MGTATQLTIGTAIQATISSGTEHDYYKFTVPAGGATVRVQTFDQGGTVCDPTNETVDTIVFVYDSSGALVDWFDDTTVNKVWQSWCEDFTVALPEGTNYLDVQGYPPTPFVYTVKVTIPT
jgi:hypothetical protein